MKFLFLDESGDHNLATIDPSYPVFVLGGVIVEKGYATGELVDEFRQFKLKHFGTNNIILHTAEIVRNVGPFARMKDKTFRKAFFGDLNDLMRRLKYQVVACAIRKDEHLRQYGLAALDPYMLSLDILIERFCFEVGDQTHGGTIIAECRGATLDRQLELAWLSLKVQGTRFISPKKINQRILSLNLRAKKQNIAGLQLADLVVSPIGRYVMGKPTREDYRIIETKFRKNSKGNHSGFGLVVLPKK